MADSHVRWRDDLVAFELGALEADEAETFRLHLETCSRCQADLDWLRPALEILPASVEQHEPPPALRRRMMAIVRTEAAEAAETAEIGRDGVGAPVRRPRIARLRRLALSPAGAVAAVAVAGAGVAGYALNEQAGETTTTVAARATPDAPAAAARVVRKGDSAMLKVERLPPLRNGHVYEVWLRRDHRMEPSSVFVLRRDGTATAAIPEHMKGTDEILVTTEPEGGSARPSTAPVLRASLD